MNSLAGWDGSGTLSPFNFFDYTDYNQWYTQVMGTDTALVSNFVYRITSVAAASTTAKATSTSLNALAFSTATAATTGDKLSYASPSNGNVLSLLFSSNQYSDRTTLFGSYGSEYSSIGLSTFSLNQKPQKSSIRKNTQITTGHLGPSTPSLTSLTKNSSLNCPE